jgi:hypothetical protein
MVDMSSIRAMTSMTSIPTIGSRQIGIKIHTNTTRKRQSTVAQPARRAVKGADGDVSMNGNER